MTSRALDMLICGLAVALVAIGVAGVYDVGFRKPGDVSQAVASAVRRPFRIIPPAPFGGASRVRLLLCGADRRPGDAGRSDTILLLCLNPRDGQAALLGIPRDLEVEIPGHGRQKINHAYAYGGTELAQETVEDLLGWPVDYTALVFFDGFIQAVDVLGGVWVHVPDVEGRGRGMNYDDRRGNLHVHLTPGFQHLDGTQAIGFVRYRKSNYHGLGDSDYARSARQQEFLRALVQQRVRPQTLPQVVTALSRLQAHVETDLSPQDQADLVGALRAVDPDDLLTATLLPPPGGRFGLALDRDDEAVREVVAQIEEHLGGATPRDAVIEVAGPAGGEGAVADAVRHLSDRGFQVRAAAQQPAGRHTRTSIEYAPGLERAARLVASALGCGELRAGGTPQDGSGREPGAPTGGGDRAGLRVVLGSDYDPREAEAAMGRVPHR